MTKKSSDEKLIEKVEKEHYSIKFEDFMDLIPQSTSVFKKDTSFRTKDVYLPANKWFVGEYVIDSDTRAVYSLDENDKEVREFELTKADYKKIIKACKERRKILLNQRIAKIKK
jgi:hypothetical protein